MSNFYAQLNENNIVECISDLYNKVDQDNLIEISEYDTFLLGKEYDFNTNSFIFTENSINYDSLIPDPDLNAQIQLNQTDRIELEIENLKTQQNEILEKLNMLLNIQGDV